MIGRQLSVQRREIKNKKYEERGKTLKSVSKKTTRNLRNLVSEYRINLILFSLLIFFLLMNNSHFPFKFSFLLRGNIPFYLEVTILLAGIISILLYQKDSLEYNAISPFPAVLMTHLLIKGGEFETRMTPVIILFFSIYLFLYSLFFSFYLSLYSVLNIKKEKERNSRYFRVLLSFSSFFGPFAIDIKKVGFEGVRDIPKIHPLLWTLAAFSPLFVISKGFGSKETLLFEYIAYVSLVSVLIIACYRFWSMSPAIWSAVDSIDIWSAVDSTAVIYIDLDQLSLLIWIIGLELYFFGSNLVEVVALIILLLFFLNNILRYRLYSERLVKAYSIILTIFLPIVSFLLFTQADRTSIIDWVSVLSIPILLSWITWQYLFSVKRWNLKAQKNLAFVSWIMVPIWMMIVICSLLYSYFVFQSGSPPSALPLLDRIDPILSTIIQGLITAIAIIGGFIATGAWHVIHSEKKESGEHEKYFVSSILALWIVFASICIRTINKAFNTMSDYCYSIPDLGNGVWYLIQEAQANLLLLVVFVAFSIFVYYLSKH